MIAIIKNKDKTTYASPIFAIKDKGWDSEALIFNQDFTHIKMLEMWKPNRQVYIVEEENFKCKKGKWFGVDWVINDDKLINALNKQKEISIEDYPKFREYSNRPKLPEWFEVKTQQDISSLFEASFGGFHDAYFEAEDFIRKGKDIQITFQSCWEIKLTVKFIDVIEEHLIEHIGEILDSNITIEENYICWKVDCCLDDMNDEYMDEIPYIKCKKMLWHLEVV
ncbi:MAG: hypothetical protein IJ371_06175 [Clostridia bacterium]|nr:hypothetical protein [Clostridia bacterium]